MPDGKTRRRARDVLDHPRRARILNHVRGQPGVEVAAVVRVLGLGWTNTMHHVRALEGAGQLRVHRIGGRTALFSMDSGALGHEDRTVLLRRPTPLRLLNELRRCPGLSQKELVARLGFTQQHVSSTLRTLESAGLVRRTHGPRHRQYYDGSASGGVDAWPPSPAEQVR